MGEAVSRAHDIVRSDKKAVMLKQFENPANTRAHEEGTAVEIWQDCGGEVDAFVAGVGTGGTVCGVGRELKRRNDTVQIVAVEPATCAVLSGKRPGPHQIQGLGAGFVPAIVDRDAIDEILAVTDKAAMRMVVELAGAEGILAGISSGANLHAAAELARRPEMQGKTIVTMLCDSGERYLTTPLADQV
jgi:cysteine synthase A